MIEVSPPVYHRSKREKTGVAKMWMGWSPLTNGHVSLKWTNGCMRVVPVMINLRKRSEKLSGQSSGLPTCYESEIIKRTPDFRVGSIFQVFLKLAIDSRAARQ